MGPLPHQIRNAKEGAAGRGFDIFLWIPERLGLPDEDFPDDWCLTSTSGEAKILSTSDREKAIKILAKYYHKGVRLINT